LFIISIKSTTAQMYIDLSSAILNAEDVDSLDLSGAFMDELPAEIGELINLKYLNISFNSFKTLPAEIGKLASLETLIANDNIIKILPEEFGDLSSLKTLNLTLNLYNNKIAQKTPKLYQNL